MYWVIGEKYLGDWVDNKKEGKPHSVFNLLAKDSVIVNVSVFQHHI